MTLSGRVAVSVLVALFLSICLNVFVGGLIAGRMTSGDPAPLRRDSELQRFIATVPRDARPAMRQAFRANRSELQDLNAEVQAARMDAAALVAAEPFDRAAFEAALAIDRERSLTLQAAVHAVIAEAIEQLPPGLRAEMAERWRDRQ